MLYQVSYTVSGLHPWYASAKADGAKLVVSMQRFSGRMIEYSSINSMSDYHQIRVPVLKHAQIGYLLFFSQLLSQQF